MAEVIHVPERVVVPERKPELLQLLTDAGIPAYSPSLPFGMKVPDAIFATIPHQAIRVGGSVSYQLAIAAIILARQHWKELKFVHLTNDEKRAHLIDIKREHLIEQVCPQEIIPPEK